MTNSTRPITEAAPEQQNKGEAERRRLEKEQLDNAIAWFHINNKKWPKWTEIGKPEDKDLQKSGPALVTQDPNKLPLLKDDSYYKHTDGTILHLKDNAIKLFNYKDFKQASSFAMDLLQYNGADSIRVSYDRPEYVKKEELNQILDLAMEKGLVVKFDDPAVKAFLANPKLISEAESKKLYERLAEVNANAAVEKEKRRLNQAGSLDLAGKAVSKQEKLETKFNTATTDDERKAKYIDVIQQKDPVTNKAAEPAKQIELIEKEIQLIHGRLDGLDKTKNELNKHIDACAKIIKDPRANLDKLETVRKNGNNLRDTTFKALENEGKDLQLRSDAMKDALVTVKQEVNQGRKDLGDQIKTLQEEIKDKPKTPEIEEKMEKLKEKSEQLQKLDAASQKIKALEKTQEPLDKKLTEKSKELTELKKQDNEMKTSIENANENRKQQAPTVKH